MNGNAAIRWIGRHASERPDADGAPEGRRGASHHPDAEIVIRRARPSDVPRLEAFVEPFVADGTLLRRTADDLYRHVREFLVAREADGGDGGDDVDRADGLDLLGCVALRVHTATLGEVCAVAVSGECRGRGLGRTLVDAAVDDAASLGLRRVFALTREPGFFRALGFRRVPDDELGATLGSERARRVWTAPVVKAALVRELFERG